MRKIFYLGIIMCNLTFLETTSGREVDFLIDNGVKQIPPLEENNGKKIEIKISLDKNTFLVGETIWVNVHCKNDGLEINDKTFILKNSKDETLPKIGIHGDSPSRDVKPSETEFTENLMELEEKDSLPPDEYVLKKVYDEFFSNEVKFRIVAPTGEEAKAYELMKKEKELMFQRNYKDTTIQQQKEFIKLYPNSIYTPKVYEDLINTLMLKNENSKALEVCKELIDRYPNSWPACRVIQYELIQCLRELGKSQKEANILAQKHKGTKIETKIVKIDY
ncbi:MAG: hypothetical protein WC614_10040 [bacterium]